MFSRLCAKTGRRGGRVLGKSPAKTKAPETEASGAFIVDNLAVWQLSSRAFRWSALPACAVCCLLRLRLWLSFQLAPSAPPQALPSVLPPDLRQAPLTSGPSGPRLSQLALGTLAPGFLWLALPTLIGISVPRHCAFDRLPASIFHQSSELASGQLPACAFFWVVRYFSDSFPTYCSFISWTDITDQLPVHASANHVVCVDRTSA